MAPFYHCNVAQLRDPSLVRSQAAMSRLRAELGLPLHARIGIHCGPVVSGIVGSQRPRFCECTSRFFFLLKAPTTPPICVLGVLGPALLDAEAVEAASSPDGVSCTGAAQRVYLSSTFTFVERAPHSGGVAPRAQQHSRTPQPTPPLQGAVTLLPGCDAPEPAAGAAAQLKLSPRGVGGLFDVAPPLSPSLLLCRVLSP